MYTNSFILLVLEKHLLSSIDIVFISYVNPYFMSDLLFPSLWWQEGTGQNWMEHFYVRYVKVKYSTQTNTYTHIKPDLWMWNMHFLLCNHSCYYILQSGLDLTRFLDVRFIVCLHSFVLLFIFSKSPNIQGDIHVKKTL